MINLKNITHNYKDNLFNGQVALSDINLIVNKGDFLAIIGQSGSGKTTLLNVMSGLLKPSEGQVFFNGIDLYNLKPIDIANHRNKNIGFIFQNNYLEPKFSSFENVCIPLLNNKIFTKEEITEKTIKALETVGLHKQMDKLVSNLSGGERQRVAIARAIVMDPTHIFADEPTGNLDTKNGNIVMNILEKFSIEGKTIILVTHNENQATRANRIIKLEDGNIIMEYKNV